MADPAFQMAGGDVGVAGQAALRQVAGGFQQGDVAFRGEGETSFADLARRLAAGASLDAVPGAVFRRDGAVVHGAPSERVADVDSLPFPAYHRVDLERYFALFERGFASKFAFGRPGSNRRVSIITSRGCPYRCSFCEPQNVRRPRRGNTHHPK